MYRIFEQLLEQKGVTAADVARGTGIAKSTFSSWKNGDSVPKADKLYAIAKYFGVPMEVFFEDGEDKITASRYEELKSKYASVTMKGFSPVYEVAAGEGRVNYDYADQYIKEEESEEYSWCEICGDSMYPVLFDGDLVRVHHQTMVGNGDIAIVKVDGESATAKYVEVADNGVWLRAENKSVFEDRFFSVQEVLALPLTIIGVVVELRREI